MDQKSLTAKQEKLLILLLRMVGIASLFAVIFVFVPYKWMNAIYLQLNMGDLPPDAVVGYLARSTSAFYFLLGLLKLLAAFDLKRYRLLAITIGIYMVAFGFIFMVIDYSAGLPVSWVAGEAASNIFFGVPILFLALRIEKTG